MRADTTVTTGGDTRADRVTTMSDNSTLDALKSQVDGTCETIDAYAALISAGETTDADGEDIWYWPLEIIVAVGRPFTVVLSTGGPHIEIMADGYDSARVVGYWAGETVTRYPAGADTVLDYFTGRQDTNFSVGTD